MSEWKLKKPRGACAVSGKRFEPGDEYYSAIVEEGGELLRLEVAAELFDDSWREKAFSYWKMRVPEPEEDGADRRKLVDVAVLAAFFNRLVEKPEPQHAGVLYLVALLLVRKKLLKLVDIEFSGDDEFLVLADRQRNRFRVLDPGLTPETSAPLKEKLAALFESPELFAEDSETPDDGEPLETADEDGREDHGDEEA